MSSSGAKSAIQKICEDINQILRAIEAPSEPTPTEPQTPIQQETKSHEIFEKLKRQLDDLA